MRKRTRRPRGPAPFVFLAVALVLGWPGAGTAQAIKEYPVPATSAGPAFITSGPDGALWFTDPGLIVNGKISGAFIGRISTAGVVTEFPAPSGSSPIGITTGPDGALWFADNGCISSFCTPVVPGQIGRITTAGAISEFPIPTGTGGLRQIVTGPDGALWFTEVLASKIGRMTTSGTVTEYPVPTPNSNPYGIAMGSDGALWFTEYNANTIGRITTAGSITEFVLPNPNSWPSGITSGPDGALWFTENGNQNIVANRIGRITTAGQVTEFPIPTPNSGPQGITSGPDGALWFAEIQVDKIGRITVGGAFAEYTVPANSMPFQLTPGPDGGLWFTEVRGGNIGTFAVANLMAGLTGSGAGQVTSATGGIACSPTSNQCVAPFVVGIPVTLTASASAGSSFSGWSGGGCTGTAPCTLTLSGDTNVTAGFALIPSFTLSVAPSGSGSGTVTSAPSGINCGTTCNASFFVNTQVTLTAAAASGSTFAGWSGGGCSGIQTCTVTMTASTTVTAKFVQDSTTNIQLLAAVLPLSRSVEVGGTAATAFATILNAGPGTATTCTIAPATVVAATFAFQTTDPTTNALTGTPNTPADIPSGGGQSFVIAFTPNAAFAPTNVLFTFGCANAAPAPAIVGINTLNLSASTSPVPDIVALAGSGDPGYVDIPGAMGTGVFVTATVNLGSAAQITVSADTGTANVPVVLTVCQTNPSTGACLAAPAPNVTTTIAANAMPTFGIFAAGSATVPDLPAINRVFVRFTDAGGVLRGATSVAVRTR
jgi:streptogramin lyase